MEVTESDCSVYFDTCDRNAVPLAKVADIQMHPFGARLMYDSDILKSDFADAILGLPKWRVVDWSDNLSEYARHCERFLFKGNKCLALSGKDRLLRVVGAGRFLDGIRNKTSVALKDGYSRNDYEYFLRIANAFNSENSPGERRKALSTFDFGREPVFSAVVEDRFIGPLLNFFELDNSAELFRNALGLNRANQCLCAIIYSHKGLALQKPTSCDAGTHHFFIPNQEHSQFGASLNLSSGRRGPWQAERNDGFHELVHKTAFCDRAIDSKIYLLRGDTGGLPAAWRSEGLPLPRWTAAPQEIEQ